MKKLWLFLLIIATITSLAACGNTKTDEQKGTATLVSSATENNLSTDAETESEAETTLVSYSDSDNMLPEEFPDFIKDYVDLSHYNDASFYEGSCSFTRNSNYLSNAELFSDYTIKLENGISVKLGNKVSELLNQGAEYVDEDDKNKSLEKQSMCTVYFKIGDKQLGLEIENNSESPVLYSNATIRSISVYYYKMSNNIGQEKYDDAMEFIFDNKISNNDNLSSIINKLGEPTLISFSGKKSHHISLLYTERKDGSNNSYNTSFDLSVDGTKLGIFNIRH